MTKSVFRGEVGSTDKRCELWSKPYAHGPAATARCCLDKGHVNLVHIGAFLAIFLGRQFNNPYLDPIASIVIGLVLAVLAVFLGRESGALLVGESTNLRRIERLNQIIRADPAVVEVGDLLTMQLGPEQVLLTVNIQFRRKLTLEQLESAIERIEANIRREQPSVQRIFIEAESFRPHEPSSKAA